MMDQDQLSAIPVLMITFDRLEYTKRAIGSLLKSDAHIIQIIDNGSTDGTLEYFNEIAPNDYMIDKSKHLSILRNGKNIGIAGAMNQFLDIFPNAKWAFKLDNDTVVPSNFFSVMFQEAFNNNIDLLQSKHFIIPATNPKGWEGFISTMKKGNEGIYYNHFIGGSGIIFRRDKVKQIPETEWMIGGWREFQRQSPTLVKAFTDKTEITLLDEKGYGDFPEYYKQTGRIK